MKKINYIELGATLFVPATHKSLESIVGGIKYPNLRSVLIDTEDGIDVKSLEISLKRMKKLLNSYEKKQLFVFIRPKNIELLKEILEFEGVDKIDGFILPKFSLSNAQEYLSLFKDHEFSLMPSIEGEELFNFSKLNELRDIILTNADRITLVRFGLEDMLRGLGMKRSCKDSVFDLSAPSVAVGNFINTFKSVGFAVSGGVYPCFKDKEGFIKDVKRDLKEGLFSKTIIHPDHIELSNNLYKVTQEEYEEAHKICTSKEAVFGLNGKMAESITMQPYSKVILQRAKVYGLR